MFLLNNGWLDEMEIKPMLIVQSDREAKSMPKLRDVTETSQKHRFQTNKSKIKYQEYFWFYIWRILTITFNWEEEKILFFVIEIKDTATDKCPLIACIIMRELYLQNRGSAQFR